MVLQIGKGFKNTALDYRNVKIYNLALEIVEPSPHNLILHRFSAPRSIQLSGPYHPGRARYVRPHQRSVWPMTCCSQFHQ